MKSLIFCALLGMAVALVPVYEPDETNVNAQSSCIMCGDPSLRSCDGAYHNIQVEGKIRLFRTPHSLAKKVCLLEIDCVVQFNYYYDTPKAGVKFVDWCGIAFYYNGKPHNIDTFRNWMIGQHPHKFGERGQGVKTWVCRNIPQTFPKKKEYPNSINPKTAPWKDAPNPKNDCGVKYAYQIATNAAKKRIEIRSACCDYAIDWYPAGRKTCINIYMKKGDPAEGKIQGMCGNCDGNPDNDWKHCNGTPLPPFLLSSTTTMATCHRVEKHSALGYPGGAKLHPRCGDPGVSTSWVWMNLPKIWP